MKTLKYIFTSLIFLLGSNFIAAQSFQYVSPMNNSSLVSLSTNIILKSSENISYTSLSPNEFIIEGNKSGRHLGDVKLSDDQKTILFFVKNEFLPDEEVNVTVEPGIKTVEGNEFSKLTFQFHTTWLAHSISLNSNINQYDELPNNQDEEKIPYKISGKSITTDSLPSDFPKITVGTSNNPSNGKIFITNQLAASLNKSIGNYLMIINNDGTVAKCKELPQPANIFKMQPNGYLSFSYRAGINWILLDTSLTPVDTFKCGNGYTANSHDFFLLPNGHGLLFAYDPEPVDMSKVVPGGNPNAIVTGIVIQEIDADKNVVFQWRSWDYLPITDSYFDLTSQNIDLIHMNGLAVDADGNILASLRHLSCIIKINRQTGDIDWILGGKENQFTFFNEDESNSPTYFSYQHDICVLPNGNITLFDNGNQHPLKYSRGVEYKLDEKNKTATLVWQYRHSPDIFTSAMGSVQRLSNGNSLIGWGIANGNGIPAFTEIHPDNSTALEMFLPTGQISHLSLKHPWVSQAPAVTVKAYEVLQGNTYTFDNSTDTTGITIIFNQLDANDYSNAVLSKYDYAPINPKFENEAPIFSANYFNLEGQGIISFTGEVHLNLNYFPGITAPKKTIVYERPDSSNIFIPLATSYDSTKNELVFIISNFGEFTFGISQAVSVYAPIPISPGDNEIVDGENPINLIWGTRGILRSYRIQVASDSTFQNNLADYSNLTSTSFKINTLMNNSKYYWRVNSTNQAGTSGWSDAFKFFTASPFIKIINPNGGEKINQDSTFILRWQSNIDDPVNIKLIKDSDIISTISDSTVSKTHAFSWKVPHTLQQDSSYKIEVTSLINPKIYGISENAFSIVREVTNIENKNKIIEDFFVSQNYPNPFNPSTVISYQLAVRSKVTINIYDILGRKVLELINEEKPAGSYKFEFNATGLSSGVYFYSVRAAENSGKNFFAIKKMLLLK